MPKRPPKPDRISPQKEAGYYYITIQMARLIKQPNGHERFTQTMMEEGMPAAKIAELVRALLDFQDRPLPPEGTPPALLKKTKAWLERYDEAETRARLKRADLTDPDIDALLTAINDGLV